MTSSLPDIPLIPPEVYASRDRGDLVLFCGAGVSVGAGGLTFDCLVDAVAEQFEVQDLLERPAKEDARELDRYLQYVERRVDLPPEKARSTKLREFVKQKLEPKPEAEIERVPVHEAILKIATDREGRTRVVTTNYDRHFRSASTNLRMMKVRHDAAPRIVKPDRDLWSSVVYLHGEFKQSDLRDLVLTSGDFGRAYITERWASRFVTELFEKFDVLFLGYRAQDPVVRYLLDAFAARPSEGRRNIWAITSPDREDRAGFEARWQAVNVRLLAYSGANKHSGFEQALIDWSKVVESPSSRTERVREILARGPGALADSEAPQTKADESQLQWLLGGGSIDVASALLNAGDGNAPARLRCSADWLPVFSRLELLALEDVDFSKPASARPMPGPELVEAPRRSAHTRTSVPRQLSYRANGFATWMAALAIDGTQGPHGETNSASFLHWALEPRRSAAFRPELAQLLREELARNGNGLAVGLRDAWELVLAPSLHRAFERGSDPGEVDATLLALSDAKYSALLPLRLLDVLQPFAEFSRPDTYAVASAIFAQRRRAQQPTTSTGAAEGARSEPGAHVSYDLVLRGDAGCIDQLERALDRSPHKTAVLFEIALGVQAHLERAHRILSAFGPRFAAFKHAEFAAVSDLGGGIRAMSWTVLADLVWHAGAELNKTNDRRALLLYEAWLAGPHLTHRRLALHAAANWKHLDKRDRLAALTGGAPEWLTRNALANEVLAVLRRLQREGVALSEHQEARRIELEDQVARQAAAADADEGVGFIAPPDPIDTTRLGIEELAELMLHATDFSTREGRTADELEVLIQSGESGRLLDVVNCALSKYVAKPNAELAGSVVVDAFPDRAARYLLAVAEHERKAGDDARISCEALLATWDRLAPVAMSVERGGIADSSREELTKALNHPAGQLAQALFPILLPESVQHRSSLDPRLMERVGRHVTGPGAAGRAFLAIAASRLFVLHSAEPEWTALTLVPHFDWKKDVARARAAWQGFLWSPRLNRELYVRLHDAFLDAFRHTEHLDRLGESLCGLLVSLALDGGDALEASGTRRVIRDMPAPLRATTIWLLGKRLEAAEDAAAELARTRVLPWLDAWPRDAVIWSDEKLADRLTSLALRCGDAIDAAARFMRDRPHVKLGRWQLSLSVLFSKHAHLLEKHALAVARLFDHVLPSKEEHLRLSGTVWRQANLQDLVDKLRDAKPPITDTPEFKRLEARL